MRTYICLAAMGLAVHACCALAQSELVQVRQDFAKDPGWEWKHNRIVAEDPPTVRQDFGWCATNHTAAAESGEIGGRMWQSTTPAWYAIPFTRPLSFKDKFSFSCRIVFMPTGGAGVAYLGFFNHEMQGWRVWNSMAVRLGGESSGQAAFGADAMNAEWGGAGGTEGFIHVPQDGKPHTLRFSYDPSAMPGPWPDPRLPRYMSTNRRSTEEILELARKDEPDLTKEKLWARLVDAHAAGLIYYLQRTGHESIIGTTAWKGYYWGLRDAAKEPRAGRRKAARAPETQPTEPSGRGAMIMQVDDGREFKFFLNPGATDTPLSMDRFGLFNLQLYHQYLDFYLSELTVNGHKVDLSKDPGWEGRGNRVEFVEQDFQRENYGFSETNWAGEQIGEIGGKFTSAEPVDPIFGYYADDVGKLTLDDPISFSGSVCHVQDSTDAGMFIGFFSVKDLTGDLSVRKKHLKTSTNSLGAYIEGGRDGKHFMPQLTSSGDAFTSMKGLRIDPDKRRHPFKMEYDPKANNGLGRITATMDEKTITLDLTAEQRKEGAVFDRFGIANLRAGGKHVTTYYDDLTYTARRPADYQPVFHKQETIRVPFPPGGRKY